MNRLFFGDDLGWPLCSSQAGCQHGNAEGEILPGVEAGFVVVEFGRGKGKSDTAI